MLQKHFVYKVFESDGSTFVTSWTRPLVKSFPRFTSRINGIFGEMVIDLNITLDELKNHEGTSIEFMNVVDLYVIDEDNPRGRCIYRGFISRYEPYFENEQGVRVRVLGLGAILSHSHYKDADFTVSHSGDDPETIGRAIIDHVNTVYTSSLFSYDNDSTDAVGTTVSIDFVDQKWIDALKKTGELAGTDWWWKIDALGKYWLKAKPSSSTHSFTLKKHVDRFVIPKDSEKIINDVVVRYDGGTATDDDSTSISSYGKRTKIISETDLKDATAGSQRATKEVEDGKDPSMRGAKLVINSQYDLESIQVGQTCQLLNYDKSLAFFNNNMMITGVNYSADSVRLDLEDLSDFGTELQKFVQDN